jgi:hypothetical protein
MLYKDASVYTTKEPAILFMLTSEIVTEKPFLDTEWMCFYVGCNCYISKYGVHCLVWTHISSTDLVDFWTRIQKGK